MSNRSWAWGWGTVLFLRGVPTPRAGISRWIEGSPKRIEALSLRRRCGRCRQWAAVWWTDDDTWRRVPRAWRTKILCVPCWRQLARAQSGNSG
jgi:hypothetical protein